MATVVFDKIGQMILVACCLLLFDLQEQLPHGFDLRRVTDKTHAVGNIIGHRSKKIKPPYLKISGLSSIFKFMEQALYTTIIGSGSYIPERRVANADFMKHVFYDPDGVRLDKMNEVIIQQFEQITGIQERRYVTDDLVTSDIAFFAARDALASSGIDGEILDYIIVAHNFGDI
jgi:hypothetical protein